VSTPYVWFISGEDGLVFNNVDLLAQFNIQQITKYSGQPCCGEEFLFGRVWKWGQKVKVTGDKNIKIMLLVRIFVTGKLIYVKLKPDDA